MEAELAKYEKYRRNLEFMMSSSGLWPNYTKHPKILRVALRFYSGFSNGIVTFGILLFCVNNATNITKLTSGLGLFFGFFSAFLKVCVLSHHQRDLVSLNDGVSSNFTRDLKSPENRPFLLAQFRTFSRFFYMFDYSVIINASLYALIPLTLIRQGKYARIYPQEFLFSYEPGGPIHWSLYLFEIVAAFFLWSATCGVDSIFGLYSLHLSGELRLLSHRFRKLKTSKNYKEDLKDCIDRHSELIKAWHLLESVFGILAIWLAITCAVVLCALIFQATSMKNLTVLKVCYLICYSFLKLVQAFSYAWFGNVIAVESKLCLESMYESCWPGSGDKRFMNDVLIVLSQKPFVFIAKNVMLLQMEMFQKIVNTSVSYFFLLRTLEEDLQDE